MDLGVAEFASRASRQNTGESFPNLGLRKFNAGRVRGHNTSTKRQRVDPTVSVDDCRLR